MRIFASLYRYMKNGRKVVNPLGLAQQAATLAPHLAAVGIDALLWPALTMAQGGTADNADGYGVQFHLNVGQWYQPTRWGYANQVQHACVVLREHGILPLEDTVLGQMDGGNNQTYYELNSTRPGIATSDPKLFPKHPACFVGPTRKPDAMFDADGWKAYGDMCKYISAEIGTYMRDGMLQAMQWRKRRFGLGGGRLDNGKGLNPAVQQFLMGGTGGYWFGEVWSGPDEIERWTQVTGRHKALDFPFYYALRGICDQGASLLSIPGAGLVALDPDHAVLFAGGADLNGNDDQNLKFNLLWAILLTVTRGGDCIVHAQHYLTQEGCYGLAVPIDNMLWFAATFCFGATTFEHVEDDVLIWSRNGDGGEFGWSGGALIGFSRDPLNIRDVRTHTPWRNQWIHDHSGHAADVWVDGNGWVLLHLPHNQNGSAANYVLYGVAVTRALPVQPLDVPTLRSFYDFTDITVQYPKGAAL